MFSRGSVNEGKRRYILDKQAVRWTNAGTLNRNEDWCQKSVAGSAWRFGVGGVCVGGGASGGNSENQKIQERQDNRKKVRKQLSN